MMLDHKIGLNRVGIAIYNKHYKSRLHSTIKISCKVLDRIAVGSEPSSKRRAKLWW